MRLFSGKDMNFRTNFRTICRFGEKKMPFLSENASFAHLEMQ
jgi:hypothetical protein